MSPVQSAKYWLVESAGLAKDALHIYVGLGVFLAVALCGRLPLRDVRPVAAAILVAMIGEVVDLTDLSIGGHAIDWGESWHDLWNTSLWPVVIFLLARMGVLRV